MKQEPFEPGNYYHIFNRGNNKENIFKEEENYSYFLNLLKKHLNDICNIFAYCLLPNHFHLLLEIKNINDLPEPYQNNEKKIHQPFSNLFNSYSKSINKMYNRTGSLFQEHLHRIKIETDEYFKELILYIHLNPEKHKIVSDFSNYSFSSYKDYIIEQSSLLKTETTLDYFENKENLIFCHQQGKIKLEILKEIEELDY